MNIRFNDGAASDPVQEGRDAAARQAALQAARGFPDFEAAVTVDYRSHGRTLVVGSALDALPLADRLAGALSVTVLLLDEPDASDRPQPRLYPVHRAQTVAVAGWLGAFEARWRAAGQTVGEGRFDLVLDLCPARLIASHQRPHGYYAPGADQAARMTAVEALLEMVGDFEKPKYFSYKERICAHGRNGIHACSACVDICSAQAIVSDGDRVKVNPYLCAGCGACGTVCPTGAMSYAYPPVPFTGKRIQAALRTFREAGGVKPVLLLHDAHGLEVIERLGESVPGRILPFALHHVASTGIDVWLAALAYGAAGIAVLTTGDEAPQYVQALGEQMHIAQAVLDGLGYAGPHFQLLQLPNSPLEAAQELALALRHAPRGDTPSSPAVFHLTADKRNTLDYALDHLHRHAQQQPPHIGLPANAPFGALAIDRQACSLCMSCVGVCPANALQDGQGAPQLRFIEKNCVQCGLCANTCPENAIALMPRILFAPERMAAVVLNESQPFHCIRCSKPFGTLQMVENMLGRLGSHPAFAANLDRLRMCGDCRVIDMMAPGDEMQVTPLRRN
jgi:ferredoxin